MFVGIPGGNCGRLIMTKKLNVMADILMHGNNLPKVTLNKQRRCHSDSV